jgi:uncharacterized protein (TIGR00255 family)
VLLSMTGHGEATRHGPGLSVAVEVRTVNNRYFKLSLRASEGYSALEPQIEAIVRRHIRRGTVQLNLQVEHETDADEFRLNEAVLRSYLAQLGRITGHSQESQLSALPHLLALPGVVNERVPQPDRLAAEWPTIEGVLEEACRRLDEMRADEGKAMARDLSANATAIAGELSAIEKRTPQIVDAYRQRLIDRLKAMLAELGVQIQPADVVREVGIFAERSDISEEIVRLKSHLEQFASVMIAGESQGRKLEFLTQEMFRETNTIGSKANDAEIARHVIEIKTAIERMREMIQNVE